MPQRAAHSFLSHYGSLFGVTDSSQEPITAIPIVRGERAVGRFQQRYQGIPVLSGEMNIQLDRDQQVLLANDELQLLNSY